jgi:hypothetical protein
MDLLQLLGFGLFGDGLRYIAICFHGAKLLGMVGIFPSMCAFIEAVPRCFKLKLRLCASRCQPP